MMFSNWKDRYLEGVSKTLFVSKAAALLLTVIAIVEGFGVIRAIQYAENPSEEAIFRAGVSPVVFFAAFGVRLVYLTALKLTLVGSSITWWLCVASYYFATSYSMYGCLLNCEPRTTRISFGIYDLFSAFPLETAGMLFILLGSFRFLITAVLAFPSRGV
jgi:hypothetical protein